MSQHDDDERAARFVARHFPEVARFLETGRPSGPTPVYGPGRLQNIHDDQPAPYVTVRVDYRLSRDELYALVAAGYASTNRDEHPDELAVDEIRDDVESELAATSVLELSRLVEQVREQIERGEHTEQMQALKRAMERAYPLSVVPDPTPRPGEPTVTVYTADHGDVTLEEPFWCTGEHPAEGYREDTEHEGDEIPLVVTTPCHGDVQLLTAALFQRPFSTHGPTVPLVAVEVGDTELHEYDSTALAGLADSMVAFAVGPLHQLIERLQLLEGDES